MKLSTRHIVPAMLLGLATVGTTTAYAFYPGAITGTALSEFSEIQQSAIQEAFEIRQAAEVRAQALLEEAGVDRTKLHEAMHASHTENRKAMSAALDAEDYEAFSDLVAGTPMAEKLTHEVFAKLIEARELKEAGDHDSARAIMEDIGMPGKGGGMMGGHHKGMAPREE